MITPLQLVFALVATGILSCWIAILWSQSYAKSGLDGLRKKMDHVEEKIRVAGADLKTRTIILEKQTQLITEWAGTYKFGDLLWFIDWSGPRIKSGRVDGYDGESDNYRMKEDGLYGTIKVHEDDVYPTQPEALFAFKRSRKR